MAAARLVRRFRGHSDRITGLRISADAGWLLSGSMDGTLRVHDIPAGRVLQACLKKFVNAQKRQLRRPHAVLLLCRAVDH